MWNYYIFRWRPRICNWCTSLVASVCLKLSDKYHSQLKVHKEKSTKVPYLTAAVFPPLLQHVVGASCGSHRRWVCHQNFDHLQSWEKPSCFQMCGPGTKMAAALPSFSEKTSAWSGDKYDLWRVTEEGAAQITTATMPGFGGAGRSRGHCLASVSYFVLLLKVFLRRGWHFSEQRWGENTSNVSAKSSSLCLLYSFNSLTFFLSREERKERGNNGVKQKERQTLWWCVMWWESDLAQMMWSRKEWNSKVYTHSNRLLFYSIERMMKVDMSVLGVGVLWKCAEILIMFL